MKSSKRTNKMECNGDKIRELRQKHIMTQEKLGLVSNVSLRTVQRAEKGQAIELETVANLAASLQTTVPELLKQSLNEGAENKADEPNAVVLRPILSGKALKDILTRCYSAKLECNIEPTAENIDALTLAIDEIEKQIPDPFEIPFNQKISLADDLRQSVSLSNMIKRLHSMGVGLYAGEYTASAKKPRFDYDEQVMYVSHKAVAEPVTVGRITLDVMTSQNVVTKVDDKWVMSAPKKISDDAPFDDEIPF